MHNVTDKQFEDFVTIAWKNIPDDFKFEMQNVTIRIEMNPTQEELIRVHTTPGTLLGLFEGIAKPQWGQATMGDQPSKISIFQEPIVRAVHNEQELQELIQIVLMHEIAHYFGYNDEQMCILDEKLRQKLNSKNDPHK